MEAKLRGIEEKASDILDRLGKITNGAEGNQNVTSLTLQAGGVGIWIACTAALMMLGILIVGSLWVSREFTRMDARAAEQEVKIDRANTFLAAIWAKAPELEKQVKSTTKESDNAE